MQGDALTSALLDDLLDTTPAEGASPVGGITAPATGRVVLVRPGATGEDRLEVRSPSGAVELAVRLTPRGAVLALDAVDLEITAVDKLSLRCRELEIDASEQAALRTGGDLLLQAQGEMDLHARGDCRLIAHILFLN